ncbi:MAG: DUF4924 family protein [Bacteroidales bacterium]|nr:DUF4924 family protein [Bacteroidales bacterium]MBN2697300.1 DUF4924 family protein [Bacteroidales bacterium]
MLIAQQKRRENIAEYLIYMYQVEDLIRAYEYDLSRIEKYIINQFDTSYETRREMFEWYRSLIGMMRDEGKERSGHLDFLNKLAGELNQLHSELVKKETEFEYREAYAKAKPNIELLRSRSGNPADHDIQVMLNGIYGLLILRLQRKDLSDETKEAFSTITELMALLSAKFPERKEI